jgi:radical SAM protein with 4Fe4S-binding SPASM domain
LPEIQDLQRPLAAKASSSEAVEKTIKKFVANNVAFKARATVTNYSVDKMIDSLKYFISLGVKLIHFEPLNVCGRAEGDDLSSPDIKKYIENYKKCIDIAAENGVNIVSGLYTNLVTPSYDYCEAVSGAKIVVTPEGYITRCYEVQDESSPHFNDFIVGKVTAKEFEFDKEKLEKLESRLKVKREKCEKCFARFICSGGCPLRDNAYRCEINRALISDAISRTWESSKS